MTHGSLFSGIGGFDLAAEWMGWENKFHCEWNPFGQKVLKHYWPNAESFSDITKTDFKKFYGTIDLLSGGFPCQPYSSAGKRKGKEDERHLWPHMLRAIKEIAPRYIVGENVRGLTNWNGGMVFEEVCAQMEDIGYQVAPFLIPASGVGAPHRRERIWFVAYAKSKRSPISKLGESGSGQQIQTRGNINGFEGLGFVAYANNPRTDIELRSEREWSESNGNGGFAQPKFGKNDGNEYATNSNSNGLHERNCNNEVNASERGINGFSNINESNGNGDVADTGGIGGRKNEWIGNGKSNVNHENGKARAWEKFPTQSPICNGDDGISTELDGITFSKWRNESIKAGGNAIVPQVAFQIFKAIEQHEILTAPAPDIRQSL